MKLSGGGLASLGISLFGTACYLIAGWFWSLSTWRRNFDIGWIVVAYGVSRCVAERFEHGELRAKDYVRFCWPTAVAFVLVGLADWSLRNYALHSRVHDLILFALFSSLLLTAVLCAVVIPRFGIGITDLSAPDQSVVGSTIRTLGIALGIAFSLGTSFIVFRRGEDSLTQLRELKMWLYGCSLAVYCLLTIKMMLSLLITRFRARDS
jgi:hypothetical protein